MEKLSSWGSVASIIGLLLFVFVKKEGKVNINIVDSPGTIVNSPEAIQIITDKESLDIRDKFGLYRNGKRVGKVINPTINEKEKTFYFEEIQLDEPIPNGDVNFIFSPFEFRKYIIKASKVYSVVTMLPPGAKGN